jgi:hypothetical protein
MIATEATEAAAARTIRSAVAVFMVIGFFSFEVGRRVDELAIYNDIRAALRTSDDAATIE